MNVNDCEPFHCKKRDCQLSEVQKSKSKVIGYLLARLHVPVKIGHTVCNIEYVVSYIYTQVSECCINKQFKLMEVLFKAQDSICEFY